MYYILKFEDYIPSAATSQQQEEKVAPKEAVSDKAVFKLHCTGLVWRPAGRSQTLSATRTDSRDFLWPGSLGTTTPADPSRQGGKEERGVKFWDSGGGQPWTKEVVPIYLVSVLCVITDLIVQHYCSFFVYLTKTIYIKDNLFDFFRLCWSFDFFCLCWYVDFFWLCWSF